MAGGDVRDGVIHYLDLVDVDLARKQLFALVNEMATQTHVTWYGQSGFKIVTPGRKVFLIDPWLMNPVFDKGKDELAKLKDVDLILLTH
jgi:hypothetical protein